MPANYLIADLKLFNQDVEKEFSAVVLPIIDEDVTS